MEKILIFVAVILVIAMLSIVAQAAVDGYKVNRIEELQEIVERLQARIVDFKEVRLIDDLEFDVIIYNLQRNLIGAKAALAEIQLVPEPVVEEEPGDVTGGETAE